MLNALFKLKVVVRQVSLLNKLIAFVAIVWLPGIGLATPIAGTVVTTSPSGQLLALTVRIDDTTTTFELTGPGYSWYSFGFDTVSMEGYSLIIEGIKENRTVVEQNLLGTGIPGSPQLTQNTSIISTEYDSLVDLTSILVERANNTGDVHDPVFTTTMTSLDVIWAYRAPASQASPSPTLNYHGRGGRGFETITFSPVPESSSMALAAISATILLWVARERLRQWSTG